MRKFIVSDKYLQGYEIIIDIRYIANKMELESFLKKTIHKFITENKLVNIKENTNIDNYHIHHTNIEEILTKNKTYYICSHSCS